jgi:hypothetical protein
MNEQPIIQNNSEIDQALKEFETKSKEEKPVQNIITPQGSQPSSRKVEGISFDTETEVDKYKAVKFYEETATPKMVKAVIKYSGGAVKNQRQAEWVLFSFVIVAVGVSLYLVFGGGNTQPKIDPTIIEQMRQAANLRFNK